ncbi:MAG: NADP-dependent phosphogluconate dehydrogenase [Catalinimonas sp.]
MEPKYDFGVVGLGVMGYSLLLNVADRGYAVIGLDNDQEKADALTRDTGEQPVEGTTSVESFVGGLKQPRRILIMVPAGGPVDAVIETLKPHLAPGDLLIDGGNTHFSDTDRRAREVAEAGFRYLGMGVSGGQAGARYGPSMMPGGDAEAFKTVQPILEAIAARVYDEPCVAYLGRGAAGHYVKMVHNGIEYGMMQLIAEAYDLLHRGLHFTPTRLHRQFREWATGELESYLIEITADIFAQADDHSDGALIDRILDAARQKGTGKWTSQSALDLGVPTPNIDVAVTARYLSALKDERVEAAEALLGPEVDYDTDEEEREQIAGEIRNALFFGFVMCFAQGMALLRAASEAYDFGLNLADVARVWRGGCIIRARMLEPIGAAYQYTPDLPNLLMDDHLAKRVGQEQVDTRDVVAWAAHHGIPTPGLSVALSYYDAYRSARLPANLTQAQRDYFGAHTYERTDRDGTFHTEWKTTGTEKRDVPTRDEAPRSTDV